jgi:hypothetical protein
MTPFLLPRERLDHESTKEAKHTKHEDREERAVSSL